MNNLTSTQNNEYLQLPSYCVLHSSHPPKTQTPVSVPQNKHQSNWPASCNCPINWQTYISETGDTKNRIQFKYFSSSMTFLEDTIHMSKPDYSLVLGSIFCNHKQQGLEKDSEQPLFYGSTHALQCAQTHIKAMRPLSQVFTTKTSINEAIPWGTCILLFPQLIMIVLNPSNICKHSFPHRKELLFTFPTDRTDCFRRIFLEKAAKSRCTTLFLGGGLTREMALTPNLES